MLSKLNRDKTLSKEKTLDKKEIKVAEKDIETSSCLYQNFYEIGLDNDVIFNDDFFNNNILDKYSPKIISKFPQKLNSFSIKIIFLLMKINLMQ